MRRGAVVAPFALALALTVAAAPAAAGEIVLVAADSVSWQAAEEVPGMQIGVLRGDPATGPHAALVRFPAGFDAPLHHHTAGVEGIVLEGTMVIGVEGQEPQRLGPGAYALIPGGARHTTACLAGADCVIFTAADGADDTILAEAAEGGEG